MIVGQFLSGGVTNLGTWGRIQNKEYRIQEGSTEEKHSGFYRGENLKILRGRVKVTTNNLEL